MPIPTWPAQTAAAVAAALFGAVFVLFITKYIVDFSPPQRLGAVQGMSLHRLEDGY